MKIITCINELTRAAAIYWQSFLVVDFLGDRIPNIVIPTGVPMVFRDGGRNHCRAALMMIDAGRR